MKNIVYLFVLLLPAFLQAQSYIKIEDSAYAGFKSEAVPAFKVEVEKVVRKEFMDHWEQYLKKQSDLKVQRTDDKIIIEKALLKSISSSLLNIYMHFEDMEDGTRMYVAFEDTVSGFIKPSDVKYGVALSKLIRERTNMVYVDTKKNYLGAEEKRLKDLESDLAAIKDDEDKISKKILGKTRDIEKIKNDIEINKSVLEEVRDEVATQRSNLNAMSATTPDEVRKSTEKELKKQEKKRDNLSKSIDKGTTNIYDLETDIRDLNYELDKLKQDEKFALDRVMEQRELVMAIKNQVYEMEK